MDMETFYDIFTRSNELIYVVDCRSQEEYDECHISGAKTLVLAGWWKLGVGNLPQD